jgi:hypothetical protein
MPVLVKPFGFNGLVPDILNVVVAEDGPGDQQNNIVYNPHIASNLAKSKAPILMDTLMENNDFPSHVDNRYRKLQVTERTNFLQN